MNKRKDIKSSSYVKKKLDEFNDSDDLDKSCEENIIRMVDDDIKIKKIKHRKKHKKNSKGNKNNHNDKINISDTNCTNDNCQNNCHDMNDQNNQNNIIKNKIEPEFITSCNNLLKRIETDNKYYRDEIKKIKKLYHQDIKSAKKYRNKKGSDRTSGITGEQQVPSGIAKLLNLKEGSVMSRVELTKKIYNLLDERGLRYENDKRVLRADEEIKKVFNLPDDVNNSITATDKNGFNFYNFQTYLAKCYSQSQNVKKSGDKITVNKKNKIIK